MIASPSAGYAKYLKSPNSLSKEEYPMREGITLQCTECKNKNYQTNKNKRNDPDRIELSKYCKFCRKHTAHKETR